jgi:hypothetical protein
LANIKENLIKLSDYPFTYSVLGSIFVIVFKTNISTVNTSFNEFIPVLIFIGIIGTIISIIDPFGRLTKHILLVVSITMDLIQLKKPSSFDEGLRVYTKDKSLFFLIFFGLYRKELLEERTVQKKVLPKIVTKNNKRQIQRWENLNLLRVLNASWINYEIDKLVSTIYFIIALVFLIFILGNPVYYDIYIKFVSFNLNSTNTNENTFGTISNCTTIDKDSEQANTTMDFYCAIRIPVFLGFTLSLIVLAIVFLYSCYTLYNKITSLKHYYELTEIIDRSTYPDTIRTELNNLDKNFLDSLNVHDWGLAEKFLKRIQIVSERQDDDRITPSV